MLVHLLVGCPLIFGPPDLSRVDLGATVSDDTEPPDTDTTETVPEVTGFTGITGDTGPITIPPELTSVWADRSIEGFAFAVTVEDLDGDMSGGDLTVDDGGPTLIMAVPEDVTIVNGQMTFAIAADDPCASWERTFQVVAHDAAGNASPMVEFATVGTGAGQAPAGPSFMDLGVIQPSWAACASIEQQHETDVFSFSVAADTQLTLAVWWDTGVNTDLDISVYDSQMVLVLSGTSVVEPEVIQVGIPAGELHTVQIYHYGGPRPQLYQLLLLPVPP